MTAHTLEEQELGEGDIHHVAKLSPHPFNPFFPPASRVMHVRERVGTKKGPLSGSLSSPSPNAVEFLAMAAP